jgi:hypothetical protein
VHLDHSNAEPKSDMPTESFFVRWYNLKKLILSRFYIECPASFVSTGSGIGALSVLQEFYLGHFIAKCLNVRIAVVKLK